MPRLVYGEVDSIEKTTRFRVADERDGVQRERQRKHQPPVRDARPFLRGID
jgi:hypothetical protein